MSGYAPNVQLKGPVSNTVGGEAIALEVGSNAKVTTVMILSNADPSVGGTERQALLLADALQAQGVGVFFLMKRWAGVGRCGTAGESRYYGTVKITPLSTLRLYPGWSFLGTFLIWALRHCRCFQIIHAHTAGLGVIAGVVGWLTRKKVIVKIPSEKDVQYLSGGGLFRDLRRWVLRRQTSRFVAVSTEMVRSLIGVGIEAKRIALIPNGVEIPRVEDHFDQVSLKSGLLEDAEAFIVLFVGRLVAEKGLERLIRVWAALAGREKMTLVIAGDGPLRTELESLVKDLNLLSSVRFLGHQHDVSKLYTIADVFVLPSRTEGMSNALLEAMAAGIPPIASNVGGNRDVIEDQNSGFLVDWDDPTTCAQVIRKLLADAELRQRIGNAAKSRVRFFALPYIARQYQQLYYEVLQE
jgi:glycosyltransferase involved in cell wall biosynthesis